MTAIISDKEKKSSSYKDGRLDTLSDEKKAKMKKFAKEYITKMMRKLDKRRKGSSSTSHPDPEPNSTKHSPDDEGHQSPADDNMDIDDSDVEGEGEGEGSTHAQSPDDIPGKEPQHSSLHDLPRKPESATDPRIRRRKEGSGWDDGYERPRGLPGFQDLSLVP